MKKILMMMLCFTALHFATFAQQKQTPAAQSATRAKVVTSTNHGATVKTTAPAPKKADGTLDMRYKANKTKVKVEGPLKKDGTKDMRYKANQPKKS